MRRTIALILALTMLLTTAAYAQVFTHPELGEEVTVAVGKALVYDNVTYIGDAATPLGEGAEGMPRNVVLPLLLGEYMQQIVNGIEGDVEIEHFNEIFSPAGLELISGLTLVEQGWVLLYALGYEDEVMSSAEAQGFTDEFKDVLEQFHANKLLNSANVKRFFPETKVDYNGQKNCKAIAITLLVTDVDGAQRHERYTFVEQGTGNNKTWVFYNALTSAAE